MGPSLNTSTNMHIMSDSFLILTLIICICSPQSPMTVYRHPWASDTPQSEREEGLSPQCPMAVYVHIWVNEWMSEWVSEWVSERVTPRVHKGCLADTHAPHTYTVLTTHIYTYVYTSMNTWMVSTHSLCGVVFNGTEGEASTVTWFGSHISILGAFPPHICQVSAVCALQRDFPSKVSHLLGVRDAVEVPYQELWPRIAVHIPVNFNHRSAYKCMWNEAEQPIWTRSGSVHGIRCYVKVSESVHRTGHIDSSTHASHLEKQGSLENV